MTSEEDLSLSSQASSISSEALLDFHEFLDTLDPELKARYQADHYALRDEEVRVKRFMKQLKSKNPTNWDWKLLSPPDDGSSDGIPKQYEEALLLKNKWYKKLRCLFLVSECTIIQSGVVRSALGVYHERFLHLISFPFTIHPLSNFNFIWNCLICFLLVVSLIWEPYLLTFQWTDFADDSYRKFSAAVSIILLIDALLMFHIGYKDPITTKVILDPVIIRRNYLQGKFWYNILTRFPYDSIMFIFTTAEERTIKTKLTWIRLIALTVKVMRFEKLNSFLHDLTISFNFSIWANQVFMHGVMVLFCVHWGACLHWLLQDVVNALYFEEHHKFKEFSWVTKLSLRDKSPFYQYINAYLRSLGNILCLDGGDFTPREYEEIFATTVLIILSVSVVSYLISTFSTMVVEFQGHGDRYHEVISCVQEYMRFRQIPKWLQQRVLAYYDGKYRGQYFPESQVFHTISGTLKSEIILHNCKHMLEQVYLFSDIPVSLMENLVQRFSLEVYIPGDVLLSPHTHMKCIYFIDDGYFGEVNEFGTCVKLLKHGDFFGEVDMLCPDIPCRTSIVALSTSSVYKLSKKQYLKCMTLYPELHEKISRIVFNKLKQSVKQIDQQLYNIETAKRWKGIILQGTRTAAEYYADLDTGRDPSHHIPPSTVQRIHYANYKRSQQEKSTNSKFSTSHA